MGKADSAGAAALEIGAKTAIASAAPDLDGCVGTGAAKYLCFGRGCERREDEKRERGDSKVLHGGGPGVGGLPLRYRWQRPYPDGAISMVCRKLLRAFWFDGFGPPRGAAVIISSVVFGGHRGVRLRRQSGQGIQSLTNRS